MKLLIVLIFSATAWGQAGAPSKAETLTTPGSEATTDDKTLAPTKIPSESVRNAPIRKFKKLDKMMATAEMKPTEGQKATGKIDLIQQKGSTKIIGRIEGLQPNSIHGLHIHEFGDCSAPDASSAGKHYNPSKTEHGVLGKTKQAHLGDLGNISADGTGVAVIEREIPKITVNQGKNQILGRSIIIHEGSDDFKTQPSGDSGGPIACGVITKLSHPAQDQVPAATTE